MLRKWNFSLFEFFINGGIIRSLVGLIDSMPNSQNINDLSGEKDIRKADFLKFGLFLSFLDLLKIKRSSFGFIRVFFIVLRSLDNLFYNALM